MKKKEKIYFREIIQSENNLLKVLKNKPDRSHTERGEHQDNISNILHYFIKSGYSKLVFYAMKKCIDDKPNFNICLSAITSLNLEIIKLAFKHFKRWDFDTESSFLCRNHCPEIIDFFVSENMIYSGLENKNIVIFQYFCSRKFLKENPRLYYYSKTSGKTFIYIFYKEKMVNIGNY